MTLTDEQRKLLDTPLDPKLAARMSPDGKGKVSYIEAFVVIEQANRIFGYGRWGYELLREERDVDPDSGAGVYSAWVRVTVGGCESVVELGDCVLSVRQGNRANAAQKSMARKGAVTDGLKRGLRHFGDQFGNSLYDKDSDIHKLIDQAEREEQRSPATRTVTTPAGAVTAPPRPAPRGDTDPWNIQAEVRAEVRERAAAGTVTLARQKDGLAELNGVPLGTTGTDLFESLRSAADLGDLGAAWIAINEHKSALGKPALDVLTLYKEQRKTELTPAPEGVSS